jgi:hypothetical protein
MEFEQLSIPTRPEGTIQRNLAAYISFTVFLSTPFHFVLYGGVLVDEEEIMFVSGSSIVTPTPTQTL